MQGNSRYNLNQTRLKFRVVGEILKLPTPLLIRVLNFSSVMRGRTVRWERSKALGLKVVEGGLQVHFPRKSRALIFGKGILARFESLADAYGMASIKLQPESTVIDCGANIGEFSMWAVQRLRPKRLVVIEPEELEMQACRENLRQANVVFVEMPLWSSQVEIEWFSAPDTGDSSLIDQGYSSERKTRTTTTLDQIWVEHLGREDVELLKLETEGAEPEALEGGMQMLKHTKYVAVDVGPERGKLHETTGEEVERIMTSAGFRRVWHSEPPSRLCEVYANSNLA